MALFTPSPLSLEHSSLSPYLLERRYWAESLARLNQVPQRLFVQRRADCECPGASVVELRLRAVDGSCLRALLVRPDGTRVEHLTVTRVERLTVVVDAKSVAETRAASEPNAPLAWPNIGAFARRAVEGRALLLVRQDEGRRLEDRVLDILRTVDGVQHCANVALGPIDFEASGDLDAVAIARALIDKRWA